MSADPRQHQVRTAFARAATRYDLVADYQREVGKRLKAGLPWNDLSGKALDLGCGTGHGSALLAHALPRLTVIALDFALPMLKAQANALPIPPLRVCADAHALPLADGCLDFCWSNLALQWCDPQLALAEVARALRPGGRFAFTTLGPGTFAELRQAFAAVDGYRHTLEFHDEAALQDALIKAGLKAVRSKRVTLVQHKAELRELLAGVRELGANRITGGNRRSGLMGKQAWQRLVDGYETQRTVQGLPLSYDTFFVYAEK